MTAYSPRKRAAQSKSAARQASNVRGFWAPYATPLEAMQATCAKLREAGHMPLTCAHSIECYKCGKSGTIAGDTDKGTELFGALAGLPKCER